MQRYGSRLLLAVSLLLSVLLIALAVIQYRWAGRVAQADLDRTRNHLKSSAALFARDFDLQLVQTYVFFQSEGASLEPPAPLVHMADVPRMVKDVYLLDLTKTSDQRLFSLQRDGAWRTVNPASEEFQNIAGKMDGQGLGESSCDSRMLSDIPALVIPLPINRQFEMKDPPALKRCVYAGLDEPYLREQVFPAIAQRDFGKDAAALYSFTVRSRSNPSRVFYGSGAGHADRAGPADVEQPLFALRMEDMVAGRPGVSSHARIFVRSFTRSVIGSGPPGPNEETGLWQLDVMPNAGSLASTLTRWREQNLLLSIAVELMLLAAVGFIVIATRRMQRLAEQKMHFVAGITHELRNPLSAICMLAGNQADGLVNTPEQVRQYGSLIQQQGGRLNEMIEQALQFAGVHSRARLVRRTELDLRRVIDGALQSRKSELDGAGFEMETNIAADLPPVLGDAQTLQQAIENLLSNAMKYADGRCWVRLTARPDADRKAVSITVEDRGIGIDPADAGQIFEPFFRGSRAVSDQIPGTGLGLSLVRSTAVLHRGTVTFQSAPGEGSSFTLRLPAAGRR